MKKRIMKNRLPKIAFLAGVKAIFQGDFSFAKSPQNRLQNRLGKIASRTRAQEKAPRSYDLFFLDSCPGPPTLGVFSKQFLEVIVRRFFLGDLEALFEAIFQMKNRLRNRLEKSP